MARPLASDIRVAPHIYRSGHGWRVYVRRDGKLAPKRFSADYTLEQLQAFVQDFKDESATLARERRAAAAARAGTFAGDADRYLKLKVVKAMPSYADRQREIARWVTAFGSRPRGTITARDIDEQLQAWHDAGSGSVNKYRAALMALYTRLDGRSAANIVKDTKVFPEAEQVVRGVDYALLERILAAVPADRSRPIKGRKGSATRPSVSRARLEVLLWTGMTPSQLGQLEPAHVNLRQRWYITPRRAKGKRDLRNQRPLVRKPMTTQARAAFRRFIAAKAWGPFDRRSLRHTWLRAQRRVEQQLRTEKRNPKYTLPRIRLYDIRHSFGTRLYRATKNLRLVGEMLDHGSDRTTRRYALGAVPDVLADGMRQFERAGR